MSSSLAEDALLALVVDLVTLLVEDGVTMVFGVVMEDKVSIVLLSLKFKSAIFVVEADGAARDVGAAASV